MTTIIESFEEHIADIHEVLLDINYIKRKVAGESGEDIPEWDLKEVMEDLDMTREEAIEFIKEGDMEFDVDEEYLTWMEANPLIKPKIAAKPYTRYLEEESQKRYINPAWRLLSKRNLIKLTRVLKILFTKPTTGEPV